MRMWKVNPLYMHHKHLCGEHCEMHMFVGCINKGKSIAGYVSGGLVEVDHIRKRHDELAAEMVRRGMKHNSPLPDFWYSANKDNNGKIDIKKSMADLFSRCPECKKRYEEYKK